MAFGTSGGNDVEIKIKVDAQGAITVLNELGDTVGQLPGKAEGAAGGFTKFEAGLITLSAGIGLAKEGLRLFGDALAALPDALERGAEVDDVATSFKRLSDQAGVTADVFLNQLNTATAETISNFDLQKAAIEAVRTGASPKEFIELTKAARALAEETGGNLTTELDGLSFAFETGMTRALKNKLGIIDLEKAEKDLATQLGITRGELTKEQTVQAARSAIIEASKKKTEELGIITKDAGDNIATLSKIVSDAKDEMFKAFANNVALNKALSELALILKSVNFKPLIDALGSIITLGSKAITTISGIAKEISLVGAGNSLTSTKKLLDIFGNLVSGNFAGAIGNYRDSDLVGLSGILKSLTTEGEKAAAQMLETALGLDEIESSAKTSGVATGGLATNFDKATKAADATKIKIEEIQKLGPVFGPGNNDGIIEFGRQMDQIADDTQKRYEQLGEQIQSSLLNALGQGFSKALSGQTLTSKDYGQLTGGFLGDLADSFAPGSGQFVDAIVQNLFNAFGSDSASTKARKSADKFFADVFDANRLGVVVDGQLQKIKDLVFQGDTLFGGNVDFASGSAFDFLKTLPADAQAAFSGVGTAFEEFLGISEDLGGQLAAVFANNIGGSLNNLQLLIQATGKSAEEMRSAVVEAFLDGELSASEALSAIQGINQVMTDGIPDGVGFVVEAFGNLKAAGVKGGRAVVDALKDIGFEAKENKQSLQDAMAQIAASGKFSAEEIQQVMDALAANGIDSVEELTNATTEQLLPVLALLENQKFPFAEAADDGQKLVDTLNNLPSQKTIDVNIRVKATGDVGALDKVSGGGSGFSNTSTGVKPGNSGSNAPRERPGQGGGDGSLGRN